MWGCRSTNHKGQTLENIINNYNLRLFNKKSPTHLDPSSATNSAIDLTLCDISLFLDFTWRVYENTCGSDYFPIVLESLHPQDDDLLRWRLNKANWEEFRSQCQKHLIVNNTETIPEFSKKLINIAKTCIPHNPTIHKRDRLWFSKECKQYYTSITPNLNLLPLIQHMTAPLIQNTENISTRKKNQLDHLASVWSLFSKSQHYSR